MLIKTQLGLLRGITKQNTNLNKVCLLNRIFSDFIVFQFLS